MHSEAEGITETEVTVAEATFGPGLPFPLASARDAPTGGITTATTADVRTGGITTATVGAITAITVDARITEADTACRGVNAAFWRSDGRERSARSTVISVRGPEFSIGRRTATRTTVTGSPSSTLLENALEQSDRLFQFFASF